MKTVFRKIAALCGCILMSAFAVLPASAADDPEENDPNEAIMLPSGMNMQAFQKAIEETVSASPDGEKGTGKGRDYASAVIGVFQGDDVLYTGYSGLTDIANDVKADENSVYEWGSISKTMIWVSVMQLWEQGKLALEADVRGYLPEGFFQHLSSDQPITMLNLMNHNAGWQETAAKSYYYDENDVPQLKEALQAIEPAQVNPPGEVTAYSNYGAAVAAYVVECVSGTDYADYVHQHILEPLHMEHTAVNATHTDNAWVCEQRKKMHSYRISPIMDTCVDLGTEMGYFGGYPCGMNVGTMDDLITYAQALVNDDAPLFEKPETQKIMFTGTDFYGDSDIPINCHGFFCLEGAVRMYGHNGATPFGQANMFFDLDSKTGVVTMCNEYSGNTLLNQPVTLAFGSLPAEKYRTDASGESLDLSGHYTMARGMHRGLFSMASILQAISLDGDAEKITGNAYQMVDTESSTANLIGVRRYADGTTGLSQVSSDIIPIRAYAFQIILFTLYALTAVAAWYMLRIRKLFKKAGKQQTLSCGAIVVAGEWARLLSALAALAALSAYLITLGNVENWLRILLGILQIVFGVLCMISGICSVTAIPKAKKTQKMRHILNTAGSVFTVSTILFFQLYQFWNI